MIKIASNLERLYGEQTRTKQAFPVTILSALLHGAAADDDEPIFREILRGAGKGLGADLGLLLGGLTGAGLGAYAGAKAHGFENLDEASGALGSGLLGGTGGTLLGAGLGGVGGYLLADKLIDSIGKKKQKSKNPGVKSAYAPPVSSGDDIRWMAGGRPVSYFSELGGGQPYLQAGNTPATSLDPGNEMAQDRVDYLRTLPANHPELTNMDPAELASMFNTSYGFAQQAAQDKARDATTPAPGQGTTLAQFAGRHAMAAVPALVKNAPRIASGVSGAANYLKNRFMPSGPNRQAEELRKYLESRPGRPPALRDLLRPAQDSAPNRPQKSS